MAGAAIKGLSKLLKRKKTIGGSKSIKKKPTPRYRKDSKTGETFLNRRKKMAPLTKDDPRMRVMGGTREAVEKGAKTIKTFAAGLGAGIGGTLAAGKIKKEAKARETKAKLKKATDKIREKDKKKKEKRKDNQRQK